MIAFQIDDMTCQHCVAVLTEAFRARDPEARVQIDLSTHRLQLQGGRLSQAEARSLIEDQGYTPIAR